MSDDRGRIDNDMRTDDPTRGIAAIHVARIGGANVLMAPAQCMTVSMWPDASGDRLVIYAASALGPTGLCFLPTPEEMVATGRLLLAEGEARLAAAAAEAKAALDRAWKG